MITTMALRIYTVFLWLLPVAIALPSPYPLITPPPTPVERRDLLSDVDIYVNSVISGLGSDVSGYIALGVPQFFQGLPTGTAVQSSLGINEKDLAAVPTQVLNLP